MNNKNKQKGDSELGFILVVLLIIFFVAPVTGEIRTKTVSDTIPIQNAPWNLFHKIEKFDPALGDLLSVTLRDRLDVVANVTLEALTAIPVTSITVNSTGTMDVVLPDFTNFNFVATNLTYDSPLVIG